MRIENDVRSMLPNLYNASANRNTRLETGSYSHILQHDTVELSAASARALPEGVIEHEPARMYFNHEINATLERVLARQDPKVRKAVYQLIEANFFPTNADYSEEERSALMAAGLTQARFIAENYMEPGDAADFMDTIHLIAAVASTRKVDPQTGQVSYVQLPQRPQGAPADYVRVQDLMQRYDPEAYARLGREIARGGNFASILIEFAKKLQRNPDWVQKYREEQDNLMNELRDMKIDNEFDHIRATTIEDFTAAMKAHLEQSTASYKDLLLKNLLAFARRLGHR
jgi:hypothetical protein